MFIFPQQSSAQCSVVFFHVKVIEHVGNTGNVALSLLQINSTQLINDVYVEIQSELYLSFSLICLKPLKCVKLNPCRSSDEQEALNSIMQDLAELHRSSRPAMFLSDLGKPKASSPKNQVTRQQVHLLAHESIIILNATLIYSSIDYYRNMWKYNTLLF